MPPSRKSPCYCHHPFSYYLSLIPHFCRHLHIPPTTILLHNIRRDFRRIGWLLAGRDGGYRARCTSDICPPTDIKMYSTQLLQELLHQTGTPGPLDGTRPAMPGVYLSNMFLIICRPRRIWDKSSSTHRVSPGNSDDRLAKAESPWQHVDGEKTNILLLIGNDDGASKSWPPGSICVVQRPPAVPQDARALGNASRWETKEPARDVWGEG